MNPVFYVTIDGEDVTETVHSRLVSLQVDDQAGMQSDKVTIEVDDRDELIKVPPKGARIDVRMGYEPKSGHRNPIDLVRRLGSYVVDEVEAGMDESGATMRITGHALYMESTFKQPRRRSYHRKLLSEIVDECAQRSGIVALIHEDIRGKTVQTRQSFSQAIAGLVNTYIPRTIAHIDQDTESDMQFLTRLATQEGCIMKIQDNQLLFAPIGKLHQISRLVSEEFWIERQDIADYKWLTQGRGSYTSVQAKYLDKGVGKEDGGELKTFSLEENLNDQGTAVPYTLLPTYANEEEAKRAAISKKKLLDHSLDTLRITCVGYPLMMSESIINIRNFRKGIPDRWLATKVKHVFDNDGYKCELNCESPNAYEEANRVQSEDGTPDFSESETEIPQ